nr:CooT family nickel-binding protein [Desulfobacula sp.]
MCDFNAYLKSNNIEKLIMENVTQITPLNETTFLLKGLLGDRMEVQAALEDINLAGNRVVLKALP